MSKKEIIRKSGIGMLFIGIFWANQIFAQPSVSSCTPNYGAQSLAGQGVVISNITFSGDPLQIGNFSNGMIFFGIDEGTVLTTGKYTHFGSTNTSNHDGQVPLKNTGTDVDLKQLQSSLVGPVTLEFDVVTVGSALNFEYVFASEEYLEYVGSSFNDVFGFFISGPGINGSFSNNGVNYAVVPNTNTYISVNTINNVQNSQYFNYNWGSGFWGPNTFAYDGFTDVLTVNVPVQCGETYHVRLVLSNVQDRNYDSAIMLKKGSVRSDFQLGPIVANVQPICEGQTLNLTTQGNNGWTYNWSDGQNGVGLTSINTIANLNTTQYSVTATNGSDCSISQSINVQVDPLNNEPPYVNGINNTGNYYAYVQAGNQICFSIPSFDNPNEVVTMTWDGGVSGANMSFIGNPHPTGTFCWAPAHTDIGMHSFDIKVKDKNACGRLSNSYTFFVKVVCEYCPVEIFYENRAPTNDPLPAQTISGYRITAGKSVDPLQADGDVVAGGETEVEFRAPEIVLDAGFSAERNFVGTPDRHTCIEECDRCCENWSGFTHELPLSNILTPNGDGINDNWYVKDVLHPYCAFNAQGFDLKIWNRWGTLVWHLNETGNSCCPFEAPAPNHPINHSSIYWDGTDNGGPLVSDGTYNYVLKLYGCDQEVVYEGNMLVIGSSSESEAAEIPERGAEYYILSESVRESTGIQWGTYQGVDRKAIVAGESLVSIFPNPVSNIVHFELGFSSGIFTLVNAQGGVMMQKEIKEQQFQLDVSSFKPGNYMVRIESSALNTVYEQVLVVK